jgi:hypothetical protein
MSALLDYLKKLIGERSFLTGQRMCLGCAGQSHFHEPDCAAAPRRRTVAAPATGCFLIESPSYMVGETPLAAALAGALERRPGEHWIDVPPGVRVRALSSASAKPADPAESGVKRRSDSS